MGKAEYMSLEMFRNGLYISLHLVQMWFSDLKNIVSRKSFQLSFNKSKDTNNSERICSISSSISV